MYLSLWWAGGLVEAKPLGSTDGKTGKKGADGGIDGIIAFIDREKGREQRRTVLVQVKSGGVQRRDVADLVTAVAREGAAIGVFITLEAATEPMRREAVSAGRYHSPLWGRDYPRIQIWTIVELLHGKQIEMPTAYGTFKQAERVQTDMPEQTSLFDE
jgi:site-specific DNA-methyltransferase (adenine-specific)